MAPVTVRDAKGRETVVTRRRGPARGTRRPRRWRGSGPRSTCPTARTGARRPWAPSPPATPPASPTARRRPWSPPSGRSRRYGLTPLARIVGYAQAEVAPKWLFLAPVEGVRGLEAQDRAADRRLRPGRDQRGVRRAGAGRRPRAGLRLVEGERQRRRDRARPPDRRLGRPDRRDAAPRAAASRRAATASRRCASAAADRSRWPSSGSDRRVRAKGRWLHSVDDRPSRDRRADRRPDPDPPAVHRGTLGRRRGRRRRSRASTPPTRATSSGGSRRGRPRTSRWRSGRPRPPGPAGRDPRAEARRDPVPLRRADGRAQGAPRPRDDARDGQGPRRGAGRRPGGHRHRVPDGGRGAPAVRRHGAVGAARQVGDEHPPADRGRRDHHALELPDGDPVLEDDARARRRQHGRVQAVSRTRRCAPRCWSSCMDEAGFPPGVVNLVTGSGAEVGDAIVDSPRRPGHLVHGLVGDGHAASRSARAGGSSG